MNPIKRLYLIILRDYFAGQALAGHLASYAVEGASNPKPSRAAGDVFSYADAMMSERVRRSAR